MIHLERFVKDVQKAPNGQNLHTVIVESGKCNKDAKCNATVDHDERSHNYKKSHSNTFLHQALKDVLGDSCKPSRFICRSRSFTF